MADISAYLSAEHAEIFMEALTKLAAADDCADPYQQGDARTATQRQADALVGFLDLHTRVDVTVDVVISADALIGTTTGPPNPNASDRSARRSPATCAPVPTPAGGGWSPTRSPANSPP